MFIEPYTGGVACAAAAAAAAATEHCTRLMELDDQLCRFVERADCNVLHTIILRDFFFFDPDDFESFFCLSENFCSKTAKSHNKNKTNNVCEGLKDELLL